MERAFVQVLIWIAEIDKFMEGIRRELLSIPPEGLRRQLDLPAR